jgi:hypothetical protein
MFVLPFIIPLYYSVLIPIPPPVEIAEKAEEHIVEIASDPIACSCVAYVHGKRPDMQLVDANRLQATTTEPSDGAVALMYYPHSNMYHVAFVESIDGNSITVSEANYSPCKVTKRTIQLPHNKIIGYF